MKKFISMLLSTLLLVNLVGCGTNTNTTTNPEFNSEVKVEEKVPQEIPQQEQLPNAETGWMTKIEFYDAMKDVLDTYNIEYSYLENGDPMFIFTDNVGICGYLDENGNVNKVVVYGAETCSYEEYQLAGKVFGIAISVLTNDGVYVNEIVTIFDNTYGIYETDEFVYEYQETNGEVVISIYQLNEQGEIIVGEHL